MLTSTKTFLRDLWALTLPYWRSEERWRSGGLLVVIVGMQLGVVALNVWFNSWNNLFYNTLQDKDLSGFWHQLTRFCYMAVLFIIVAVYQTYLLQMLQIRWRRWLTEHYITRWLDHRAYYRIQIGGANTDNPDQRIAEDVSRYVDCTLSLSLGFLGSVVTLVSFTSILWGLSGSVSWQGVTIPGYMLWVAIAYAFIGSWLYARLGRPLISLNFQQQQYEANFRYSLVRLRENAEGVALYGGEEQERQRFSLRFADVLRNWWAIMLRQKRLNWFSNFYGQIAIVFPFVVAAPRYFSGALQLGGLMQTASAFGQVQGALSWFINVFSGSFYSNSLAEWKAVVDRLTGFEHRLAQLAAEGQGEVVRGEVPAGSAVTVSGLDLKLPDGTELLHRLYLELPPGSHTLVTGPTGSGKSTLFRALAGIWPFAKGAIAFPAGERLLFLPQKPYLPIATLRAAVCYPDAADKYGDEAIRAALADCGLGQLAGRLDEEQNWGQLLSGGEQQRLAIARTLMIAPRWLFLDEATSAVDDASQAALYRLLAERLKGSAIVSIAHRPELAAFHERRFALAKDGALAPARLVAAE